MSAAKRKNVSVSTTDMEPSKRRQVIPGAQTENTNPSGTPPDVDDEAEPTTPSSLPDVKLAKSTDESVADHSDADHSSDASDIDSDASGANHSSDESDFFDAEQAASDRRTVRRIRRKKSQETRLEKDAETCLSSEDEETGNTYYDSYPGRRQKYPTFEKMVRLTAVRAHNQHTRAQHVTDSTLGLLLLDLAAVVTSYLPPVIPISVFWKNNDWYLYPMLLEDADVNVHICPTADSPLWATRRPPSVKQSSKKKRPKFVWQPDGHLIMLNPKQTVRVGPPSEWSALTNLGGQLLQTAGDVHALSPLVESGNINRDCPGVMICEYRRWFLVLCVVSKWDERDYFAAASLVLCDTLEDAQNVMRQQLQRPSELFSTSPGSPSSPTD